MYHPPVPVDGEEASIDDEGYGAEHHEGTERYKRLLLRVVLLIGRHHPQLLHHHVVHEEVAIPSSERAGQSVIGDHSDHTRRGDEER